MKVKLLLKPPVIMKLAKYPSKQYCHIEYIELCLLWFAIE